MNPMLKRLIVQNACSVWGIRIPRKTAQRSSATRLYYTNETSPATSITSPKKFRVVSRFEPSGDQPEAIAALTEQLAGGNKFSVLKGITGSGKSFVMSHVISNLQKPTLILCPTKTLAAQLCRELRSFLPSSSVELFVSYYNYYTPESFIESSNTYIAKKSSINDEIDSLRHRATRALFTRDDVVIVASVSCIYGLGLPSDYLEAAQNIQVGSHGDINFYKSVLEKMLYDTPENMFDLKRGNFLPNYQNNTMKIWPPYETFPLEVCFDFKTGKISKIIKTLSAQDEETFSLDTSVAPTPDSTEFLDDYFLYPARHFVTPKERTLSACDAIEEEMKVQTAKLRGELNFEAAERLRQRVSNDLLLLRETGTCPGVENYSRHFAGRPPNVPPETLLDYLKLSGKGGSDNPIDSNDWLLIVDESHVTLPQLKAMYGGDRARKISLVKNGYRLPSAFDNRPLKDDEFWERVDQGLFVSATPGKFELDSTLNGGVDMVIRPTNIMDPPIFVRSTNTQLRDLRSEIVKRAEKGEKTLAMAITKRDAEDMASYLLENDVKATYIHSDLNTVERAEALKSLQNGTIDCLVGVNLMREGIDLPQVSLVAIMSADNQGFLRSETALLQMVGRAARNVNGEAIFYADKVTPAMQSAIDTTNYRREKQQAYNLKNNKVPISARGSEIKSIFDIFREEMNVEELGSDVEWSRSRKVKVTQPVTTPRPALDPTLEELTYNLPAKTGIYMWKTERDGETLYIGKAKNLNSRCKSYLTGKDERPRINGMMKRVKWVEYILTPTEQDALNLEAKLINLHQPPYNVALKDDFSFPYIVARVSDELPRFERVPKKPPPSYQTDGYEYYGPYSTSQEADRILKTIEDDYNLRKLAFEAKNGENRKEATAKYLQEFENCRAVLFESEESHISTTRVDLLFDEEVNKSRDVIGLVPINPKSPRDVLVRICQLRKGIYRGERDFQFRLPPGLSEEEREHELGLILFKALERHYQDPQEEVSTIPFSFLPESILTMLPLSSENAKEVRRMFKVHPLRETVGPPNVRSLQKRGRNKNTDAVAMQFVVDNLEATAQEVREIMPLSLEQRGTTKKMIAERSKSLKDLLNLPSAPSRIECYDVSHSQGDFSTCSRVVFIDGKPEKSLYRIFNIKSFSGNDDYRSLTEVLERRFKRAYEDTEKDGGEWSVPDLVVIDGGKGQLNAACKGLRASGVGVFGVDDSSGGIVVPICALAKKNEEVYAYNSNSDSPLVPLNDSPDNPGVLMLRQIRDESHRFAITRMRQRRRRSFLEDSEVV